VKDRASHTAYAVIPRPATALAPRLRIRKRPAVTRQGCHKAAQLLP
jgi:hypothetical protein